MRLPLLLLSKQKLVGSSAPGDDIEDPSKANRSRKRASVAPVGQTSKSCE